MDAVRPEDIEINLEKIYLNCHVKERQQQRDITNEEIQAALKYGKKSPCVEFGAGRWKYRWGDIVVVTGKKSTNVLTVFRAAPPRVHVQKAIISKAIKVKHAQALERLKDYSTWKSHTVAVIDTSGSMRNTDTDNDVSRGETVWLTVAVKFVAQALKSGERGDSDVFSLVGMQKGHHVIFSEMPFDWILYNKLIDMQRTHCPLGHGEYFPALKEARSLLMKNRYGGCALALLFLSDGMPSDEIPKGGMPHSLRMEREISDMASRIGSRLSVCALPVGKGCRPNEFATLEAMTRGASTYGCKALLEKPSLSAHALGTSLTKLTSTTTATKTELGSRVCRHFRKEPMSNVARTETVDEDYEYVAQRSCSTSQHVQWSIRKSKWNKQEGWVSFRPRHTFQHKDAVGVGIKKLWFGEGTERLVKEFREVGPNGVFVGPVMVAKDTKYVTVLAGREKEEVAKDFHKRFIKCQILAEKCAGYFHRQLARHPAIDASVFPKIEFLDCWVYMIQLDKGERKAYLVEKMLDIQNYQFQKWNDNKGGFKPSDRFELVEGLLQTKPNDSSGPDVEVDTSFSVDDIPQAFSCFTHWFSRGHFVVCDLQGVFNTGRSPPTFELTDAVIHHRSSNDNRRKYGNTDHGVEGIEAFLKTHRCCSLCRMVRAYAYIPWVKDEDEDLPTLTTLVKSTTNQSLQKESKALSSIIEEEEEEGEDEG